VAHPGLLHVPCHECRPAGARPWRRRRRSGARWQMCATSNSRSATGGARLQAVQRCTARFLWGRGSR
jgi:hypothetical protein